MNTIAIIGAMPSELADIRKILGDAEVRNISGFDFYINERGGKKIINACCGIAKVNAALCAQVMTDNFKPDCIINWRRVPMNPALCIITPSATRLYPL